MAMHESKDLYKVNLEIYSQLVNLEIKPNSVNLMILKEGSDWYFWSASDGAVYPELIHLPFKDITLMSDVQKSRLEGKKSAQGIYSKRQKNAFFNHLNDHFPLPKKRLKQILDSRGARSIWTMAKKSGLHVNRYEDRDFDSKEQAIVGRFAEVFDRTYTRFLDLQKAEAQAREAQIEISLERVRAQAMAMRKSEDLVNSTKIVFEELEKLNLSIQRSGIGIFDDVTRDCHLWTTVISKGGKKELATGITSMTIHPMLIKTFDCWKSQKSISYVLEGKELEDYYGLVSRGDFIYRMKPLSNQQLLLRSIISIPHLELGDCTSSRM